VESLGFRLSVAASLALAFVLPPLLDSGRHSAIVAAVAATAAAQIATLPLLLPMFGMLSLSSLPANILVAPLIVIAMPLAALAGMAGVFWPGLGEFMATPATVAAEAVLTIVDTLGAPNWYVAVGIPTRAATVILAVTAWATLLVLSGECARAVQRVRALDWEAVIRGRSAPAASRVIRRKHPADALGADTHDAEHEPPRQEDGHQVADEGQGAQTIAGEIGGHVHPEHAQTDPEGDGADDQDQDETLPPASHLRDVVTPEVIQPGLPG
jgi:hypothetical protein